MALTLSSVIVTLVSSVFLTQNNFYRSVVQRTRVQDNLRVATDLIASEVRAVAGGGVTTAEMPFRRRHDPLRKPLSGKGLAAIVELVRKFHEAGLTAQE